MRRHFNFDVEHVFRACTQPLSGLIVPIDPRGGEAGLDSNAIEGIHPVALFNRTDLASMDGSDRGEYRVAYAKNKRLRAYPTDVSLIFSRLGMPTPRQIKVERAAHPWLDSGENLVRSRLRRQHRVPPNCFLMV